MYIMPLPTLAEVNIYGPWITIFVFFFLLSISIFSWGLGQQGRVHGGLWTDRCSYATHVSFFQSYFLSAPTLLWTWTCHCSSDIFVPFAQNSFLNIAVKNFYKEIGSSHLWNAKSSPCEKPPNLYISLEKLSQISAVDGWLKMWIVQQKCVSHAGLCLKWWQRS